MWIRPLLESDASCGGKAVGLAKLVEAGLPVPDGFVIDDRAFQFVVGDLDRDAIGHALEAAAARISVEETVPAALVDAVNERARHLGRVAVRSSASIEDGAIGSAAGVFASVTDVDPRDVWAAIRAVWTSALTPLAATYARGRAIAIGVIVQRFIEGQRVVIYTRPPGVPDGRSIVVQRGEYMREYSRDDVDPLVALALRAELAIHATAGADVELVETRDGTPWIVQARPIVHPPPPTRTAPPPALLAALEADGRRWTWDVAHNPDPLSPAQAGLVERVERAQIAPWSMRVVAGYLYTTPRATPAPAISRGDAIEARFAQILDEKRDLSLAEAIERYIEFYEVWSCEMVPLVAEARRGLTPVHVSRPSSVEATLLAAARGELDEHTALDRLAPLSPTWDVAVPTFGERPEIIRDAIERAKQIPRKLAITDDTTREAADLGERDDLWFAKAQRMIRRALLRRAAVLGIDGDDICWLSLDDVVDSIVIDPDDAHRRASAAKAAYARAARWAMPLVVGERSEDQRPVLHGYGSGARVSGRVVRFASLASAVSVSSGDIIVARAITPALAVFVVGCAAIISETGGLLDHGAAIARELGIPFVVGCKDAWSLLRDGMIVTIDHDRVTTD